MGLMIESISQFRGSTRWLSNFHEAPIEYHGIIYPTTEHAYQAMKSNDIEVHKIFASLPTARLAKRLGAALRRPLDWETKSLGIMKEINLLKFSNHPNLKAKLLATGDMLLEEGNTWGDVFWGTVNGEGENNLGKILMEIREELKQCQ